MIAQSSLAEGNCGDHVTCRPPVPPVERGPDKQLEQGDLAAILLAISKGDAGKFRS